MRLDVKRIGCRRVSSRTLLLLTLFVAGAALCAAESPVSKEEKKLRQLRQQIDSLQQDLAQTRDEHSSLNRQLSISERAIGKLTLALRRLDEQIQEQKTHLQNLHAEESRELSMLAAERAALATQIRAAYATGRQERLKILFNQQDPDKISRVMAYYDYLNRARALRMEQIKARLQAVRDTRAMIRLQESRLQDLKQQRLSEKRQLEQTHAERQKIVARLSRELQESGKELHSLELDEHRLATLLARLEQALADSEAAVPGQADFKQRKGELPWPVKGKIQSFFGTAKIGNLRWDGVMIGAPEGNDVVAVHPGRVAYADWLRGFGLLLIIDHGNGYMTLYGHNQSLFKETGDWVEAGEAVALIGRSGGRDTAGVYFGIRHRGKPVNPTSWCEKRRGRRVG